MQLPPAGTSLIRSASCIPLAERHADYHFCRFSEVDPPCSCLRELSGHGNALHVAQSSPGGLQELIHHAAVSGGYQRLAERFSEERLSGAWVFICGYLGQHLQGGRLSISTASPAHIVSLAHLEALPSIHDWTVQGESRAWAGCLPICTLLHAPGWPCGPSAGSATHTGARQNHAPAFHVLWGAGPLCSVRISQNHGCAGRSACSTR